MLITINAVTSYDEECLYSGRTHTHGYLILPSLLCSSVKRTDQIVSSLDPKRSRSHWLYQGLQLFMRRRLSETDVCCLLHVNAWLTSYSTLKMEAKCSGEMSMDFTRSAHYRGQEDECLKCWCESLRPFAAISLVIIHQMNRGWETRQPNDAFALLYCRERLETELCIWETVNRKIWLNEQVGICKTNM
jgi:hypothetical protein